MAIANNKKISIVSNNTTGETVTVNVGYANPTATEGVLSQFAKYLNRLTTNTFNAVKLTTIDDITNASNGEG